MKTQYVNQGKGLADTVVVVAMVMLVTIICMFILPVLDISDHLYYIFYRTGASIISICFIIIIAVGCHDSKRQA